jgi:hypothetical protein
MLRAELERRRLRWQTVLIAVAGILIQVLLILVGFVTKNEYPIITVVCLIYVVISITGSSVLAIVYTRKGGLTI